MARAIAQRIVLPAETNMGLKQVRFIAYGQPAPQGSKRFVGVARSGRGILIESSKAAKPWRQDVHAAALEARRRQAPLDGPLSVRMVFTVPKPASAPKRRKTWPMRKPDLDKLARSTTDALVTAGLIRDDARIVEYTRLAKVFAGEDEDALDSPGVRIEITVVEIAEMRRAPLMRERALDDPFNPPMLF